MYIHYGILCMYYSHGQEVGSCGLVEIINKSWPDSPREIKVGQLWPNRSESQKSLKHQNSSCYRCDIAGLSGPGKDLLRERGVLTIFQLCVELEIEKLNSRGLPAAFSFKKSYICRAFLSSRCIVFWVV
jgi:hypothetical protein